MLIDTLSPRSVLSVGETDAREAVRESILSRRRRVERSSMLPVRGRPIPVLVFVPDLDREDFAT
jgi:hypothetical protein